MATAVIVIHQEIDNEKIGLLKLDVMRYIIYVTI